MRAFYSFVFAAALATNALAQQFTINTPMSVSVCLPVLLAWTGGEAPYFLSVNPAGQPDALPLVTLGQVTGTSVTWIANIAVGTSAFLNLRDNTGTLAQSGIFTIQPGSNTTCVGQPPVVASPSGGSVSGESTTNGGSSSSANSSSTKSVQSSGTGTSGASQAAHTGKSSGAMTQHAPISAVVLLTASIFAFIH